MQNYIDLAKKNGVELIDTGKCQFCGANVKRGIHECVEIFSVGFQEIDYSATTNHKFIFLIADAHTLQHPEIHGRWSNHFHLTRLHLVFEYKIKWQYQFSPVLSKCLNEYKTKKQDEYLASPPPLKRGNLTTTDIKEKSDDAEECKLIIENWAKEVYESWQVNYLTVNKIAQQFLEKNK